MTRPRHPTRVLTLPAPMSLISVWSATATPMTLPAPCEARTVPRPINAGMSPLLLTTVLRKTSHVL